MLQNVQYGKQEPSILYVLSKTDLHGKFLLALKSMELNLNSNSKTVGS